MYELPCVTVAQLIGSDELCVKEESILAAVRSWLYHDKDGRKGSFKELVSLIWFPLLPVDVQLTLPSDPLLMRLMRHEGETCAALGMQMLMECSSAFKHSDGASACLRLQTRGPTASFAVAEPHFYTILEDGALLQNSEPSSHPDAHDPGHRVVRCGQVMRTGLSCAEFTLVKVKYLLRGRMRCTQKVPQFTLLFWSYFTSTRVSCSFMMLGVARPTLDVNKEEPYYGADSEYWGMCQSGSLYHDAPDGEASD